MIFEYRELRPTRAQTGHTQTLVGQLLTGKENLLKDMVMWLNEQSQEASALGLYQPL